MQDIQEEEFLLFFINIENKWGLFGILCHSFTICDGEMEEGKDKHVNC